MTKALASALVDVFTSLTGIVIATAVVVGVFVSLGSAFGVGGVGLWRRRREKRY